MWAVILYGSEAMRKRLEEAEKFFYRRMLKISWVRKVSNERVLDMIGTGRQMMKALNRRRLKFFGHVMRKDGLEKLLTNRKTAAKTEEDIRTRTRWIQHAGVLDIGSIDVIGQTSGR